MRHERTCPGPSVKPRSRVLCPRSFPWQAIAIVAGAKEDNSRRQDGARELEQAGLPSLFVTLPDAYHGQFGPEGDRVMGEALTWLLGRR